MKLSRFALLLAVTLAASGSNVAIAADEPDTAAAVDTTPVMEESRAWLALMDQGRYGDAWEIASEGLRTSITREKWEIAAQEVRNAAGLLVARKLRTATYTRQLPGAPEGEYVAIAFDSRFERRSIAIELLTAQRGADGRWRIAGYAIR